MNRKIFVLGFPVLLSCLLAFMIIGSASAKTETMNIKGNGWDGIYLKSVDAGDPIQASFEADDTVNVYIMDYDDISPFWAGRTPHSLDSAVGAESGSLSAKAPSTGEYYIGVWNPHDYSVEVTLTQTEQADVPWEMILALTIILVPSAIIIYLAIKHKTVIQSGTITTTGTSVTYTLNPTSQTQVNEQHPVVEQNWICTLCGTKNPPGATFCTGCRNPRPY